jgi:hypothetical protein
MPALEMKDGDPGHQMACWFPGPDGAPGTITPATIIDQIKAERAAGQGPGGKQLRSSGASHGTGGVDPNTGLPPVQ